MKYKTNASFKHKNGRVNNNEPFVNRNQCEPGNTQNKAKQAILKPFWARVPKETQATERLYKGAPPGAPNDIRLSDFEP